MIPTTPFITQDALARRTLEMAEKVALSTMPVLILGETGTGKEVIARRIHRASARANEPLVSINCGALQDNLLLSELFGHEKGAFTGAHAAKAGLVESADGGTLFLDEIGEIGLDAQAKLLRFLQEGEVHRLGSLETRQVNVRVIAATNRPIDRLVKEGMFRSDLYYRIQAMTLRIPPLRERPGDIAPLFAHFLDGRMQFSAAAAALVRRYTFPGNVRELRNMAERFLILVEGEEIHVSNLPEEVRGCSEVSVAVEQLDRLDDVERSHILRVLARFEGNKTRAASVMGITVKTLYNKLASYSERET